MSVQFLYFETASYAANTSFMFQPIVYLLYIFLNYGGTMHYI